MNIFIIIFVNCTACQYIRNRLIHVDLYVSESRITEIHFLPFVYFYALILSVAGTDILI